MSTFSDICSTAWKLKRGDVTPEQIALDWCAEKFEGLSSPVHRMPDELRNQHLLAVGRSGCGKSSFLYGLMASELPRALERKLTLIYVDPVNGVDKVINEANLANHENVFLVDPSDPESLPRLNLFETGIQRGNMLATSHMINTFTSVCAGLLDQEMTPNMKTVFTYCARVLMHVPNMTLHDLMSLLNEPIGFLDALGIEEASEEYIFFRDDVVGTRGKPGGLKDAVKYIKNRVYGLIGDPIICRLFINRHPTMKIAKVIEAGSIILVSTRKADIGQDGARLIGKFFKTVTNRVIQERAHAKGKRVPVRYYEDEFQNSLSSGTDAALKTMLDENRKFGLSINLATTRFGHLSTDMGDAVLNCTGTKVCGTMVAKGVGFIAPEIGRTAAEIKDLPNYSLYVKCGDMKHAVKVKSPKDPFKKFGRTDPHGVQKLQRIMRRRFGTEYIEKRDKIKDRNQGATPEASGIQDVEL